MTKLMTNEPRVSPTSIFESGIQEGLEIAARIADRHSALQQHFAEACDEAMPNSAHAFLLQKLVARRMAEQIRDAQDVNLRRRIAT
jgi:hypothetical protein